MSFPEQLTHIKENAGWLAAVLLFLATVFKYLPVWVRAFRETHNAATATLITGLQRRLDQMEEELSRRETTIKSLVAQQHDCKEETRRMEEKIRELRDQVYQLEHPRA